MRIAIKNPYELIFALYVGTGPIYWFPWVDVSTVSLIKTALFSLIILRPLFRSAATARYFPGGKTIFLLSLAFIGLSLPGLVIGEPSVSLYRLQNIFQITAFLFSCGLLLSRKTLATTAYLSFKIFLFFALISVALILIIPDYPSPLSEELSMFQTGLGGGRTSWSPAMALYLPWAYVSLGMGYFYSALAITALVANQVLVAGRTGMLAALLSFVAYGILRKKAKIFLFVSIMLIALSFIAIDNLEALRLTSGGFNSRADLDELSTGRIDGYIGAISEIVMNPLIGLGSGVSEFSNAHNVFLKAAVEGGLPFSLLLLWLIAIASANGLKKFRRGEKFALAALLTVLSGFTNALFEPVGMLGSFNNSCFWWMCFAICVSRSDETIEDNADAIRA